MRSEAPTMRGLVLDDRQRAGVSLCDGLAQPRPRAGQIRVRVAYASLNGHEFALARDPLVRISRFLWRGQGQVETGLEFAGIVDSDGARFRRGDRVMGYVDMIAGWKPHADYLAIDEAYVARAPQNTALELAAALPMSAQTALVALREVARVGRGDAVLVLGASGGVGVMAVQIARILGAEVTAVASQEHHGRLAALGAAQTVDYRAVPLERMKGSFCAVLDFSSTAYLAQVKHLLAPEGVFVPADPMRNLADVLLHREAKWLMVDRGRGELLKEIAGWVEAGELQPVVSEVFELHDWREAVARSRERGRIGRTMLSFA